MSAHLYHYSTHPVLSDIQPGAVFELRPGTQCAEGAGVYFAEAPRLGAADAIAAGKAATGCVVIARPASKAGWWTTKFGIAKKFGRPVTWHTDGKSLVCKVDSVDGEFVHCSASFA